ncbi:PhzF family phenazine biosynthesis protein [Peribacillus acanthi]|uniref:PhzF family phenazine biosynthesis protein n=1 Tax=Peribacillus acanthi TaxID=2171554 RepID=UPI000D3EA32B|nr:PhzF family phenazine biosynthesis isomerase [Peribacillus acanthi]
MKQVQFYHYEAFTKEPYKGNPAGLVLEAETLLDEEMLSIAKAAGFTETSFLLPSQIADVRIRYFTPGYEMDLCGHATIATIFALKTKGLLNKTELTIETKAGVLPIRIDELDNGDLTVTMRQAAPLFKSFEGSTKELASLLSIPEEAIDTDLPILYGSTGVWTLLIPIRSLDAFKSMNPLTHLFPQVLKEMPRASLHPFSLEVIDESADMHARHFSSPFAGTVEDPVTGTASGVMGAYYATFLQPNFDQSLKLTVEQGMEMGRNGRVHVQVTRKEKGLEIEISGTAVFVEEYILEY